MKLKWIGFRLLEALVDFISILRLKEVEVGELVDRNPVSEEDQTGFIWVYLSTIGELNAVKPFLDRLVDEVGESRLVLVTDHRHYIQPFLNIYKNGCVLYTRGASKDVALLKKRKPPILLIIGEIPLMLSDAPCRFPFAFIYEVKRVMAPIVVVNGWLYQQSPSCTMDVIERNLFGQEYFSYIDMFGVQNVDVQLYLEKKGVDEQRIFIMGNIKFDAIQLDEKYELPKDDWASIIANSPKKSIIAGCVSEFEEQQFVLRSFKSILDRGINAILVIAPRHPEFLDRMNLLIEELDNLELKYQLRTDAGTLSMDTQVIVLNTIGELRKYYSLGCVAYVGTDHNVLEPLSSLKPVLVGGGWHSGYPSFPVYQKMHQNNVIVECLATEAFANVCSNFFENDDALTKKRGEVEKIVESEKGATEKVISVFKEQGWWSMLNNG